MKRLLSLFFLLGVVSLSHVSAVEALMTTQRWMDGEAITKSFHDATIDGAYASGRPFQERYRADGRVEYEERGLTMGGRWSVTSGTLCTIYDIDPTGGCFRVRQVAANCFEFYFVARTEEAAPGDDRDKPKWTARGSIAGIAGQCAEGADV